jgi:hypothetical protein
VSFGSAKVIDSISIAGDTLDPEVVQLRSAVKDILDHLFKLAIFIRRPVPQDRLIRSAKIDVRHFEQFDFGFVKDCFPNARSWLQERLAKAITRRRQHLVYNRKHREKLLRPRPLPRTDSAGSQAHEYNDSGSLKAPDTIVPRGDGYFDVAKTPMKHTVVASTRFASTIATEFRAPEGRDANRENFDWEAGTQSSYASTLGGKDVICIPPRPKDADGIEMRQFECRYCFHIQDIISGRAWR